MIITSAQMHNEVYGPKQRLHPDNHFWDYLALEINGVMFRAIFELNKAYGRSFIRQWSVDGSTVSTVLCKYTKKPLTFDCSNGLCGERLFENDDFSWEFFLKPMGITYDNFLQYKSLHDVRPWELSPYLLLRLLEYSNIPYKLIVEGRF